MSSSRRRPHVVQDTPWSSYSLQSCRAYYLDSALAPTLRLSYSSALQAYRAFCTLHGYPLNPTPDTLSLFIIFKSHALRPSSVSSYLSAVISQLKLFYPNVRMARQSPLVKRTLAGIHRVHGAPIHRKQPMLPEHLIQLVSQLGSSIAYNDILFLAQVMVGFDQLLRLAELCIPDNPKLFDS